MIVWKPNWKKEKHLPTYIRCLRMPFFTLQSFQINDNMWIIVHFKFWKFQIIKRTLITNSCSKFAIVNYLIELNWGSKSLLQNVMWNVYSSPHSDSRHFKIISSVIRILVWKQIKKIKHFLCHVWIFGLSIQTRTYNFEKVPRRNCIILEYLPSKYFMLQSSWCNIY